MISTQTLGLVAAWFVFGMARIVFTSKLAEHRIDNPDPARALSVDLRAASARANAANYDPLGRRLLPWYRVVDIIYRILAVGGCVWGVYTA